MTKLRKLSMIAPGHLWGSQLNEKIPSEEYLEKARRLSKNEAEHLLTRMRGKLNRRVEDRKVDPVHAVALQLKMEDDDLKEWRERWAEITARENKKKEK